MRSAPNSPLKKPASTHGPPPTESWATEAQPVVSAAAVMVETAPLVLPLKQREAAAVPLPLSPHPVPMSQGTKNAQEAATEVTHGALKAPQQPQDNMGGKALENSVAQVGVQSSLASAETLVLGQGTQLGMQETQQQADADREGVSIVPPLVQDVKTAEPVVTGPSRPLPVPDVVREIDELYLATLGVDPPLRASAEQQAGHKWVLADHDVLSTEDIVDMERQIRETQEVSTRARVELPSIAFGRSLAVSVLSPYLRVHVTSASCSAMRRRVWRSGVRGSSGWSGWGRSRPSGGPSTRRRTASF